MGRLDRVDLLKNLILLWLMVTSCTWLCGQDFVVVVSQETPIEAVSLFQLRQIYLGKIKKIQGHSVRPINVRSGDPLRQKFETLVFPKDFDLEEYWVISKLRGGPDPPLAVRGWGLATAYIAKNPGLLGYIPSEKRHQIEALGLKEILIEGDVTHAN